MRLEAALVWLVCGILGCGGAPPRTTPPTASDDSADAGAAAAAEEPGSTVTIVPAPEASPPASNASFEQATSVPEPVTLNDDHVHLTDNQLTSPMRGVLEGCSVPRNAKVTIKTAVQNGRAIGVTVEVVFDKPKPKSKSKRRVPKSAAAAEAKAKARIIACADHAVRAVTWPPSRRRDSFTTTY